MSSLLRCQSTAHKALSRDIHRRWMSVRPATVSGSPIPPRKKVTIQSLHAQKASKTPIAMLTAYDYPTATACSSSQLIDITLVGDSLAQVCLGYTSTTQLTLPEMIHHARAVSRGTTHPLLVADMPFGTYHTTPEDAVRNAIQLVKEANVEAVKLEGGRDLVDVVRKLTAAGIPVMAHVGLMPQRHVALSGYRIQGRTAQNAKAVLDDAVALQNAGAFSVLVEGVTKELGRHITEKLRVPTIGIGAGPGTDGQVLVWDDAFGTWSGHKAKFVRRFANLRTPRDAGVESYAQAVKDGSFPGDAESYNMDQAEWLKFLEIESST